MNKLNFDDREMSFLAILVIGASLLLSLSLNITLMRVNAKLGFSLASNNSRLAMLTDGDWAGGGGETTPPKVTNGGPGDEEVDPTKGLIAGKLNPCPDGNGGYLETSQCFITWAGVGTTPRVSKTNGGVSSTENYDGSSFQVSGWDVTKVKEATPVPTKAPSTPKATVTPVSGKGSYPGYDMPTSTPKPLTSPSPTNKYSNNSGYVPPTSKPSPSVTSAKPSPTLNIFQTVTLPAGLGVSPIVTSKPATPLTAIPTSTTLGSCTSANVGAEKCVSAVKFVCKLQGSYMWSNTGIKCGISPSPTPVPNLGSCGTSNEGAQKCGSGESIYYCLSGSWKNQGGCSPGRCVQTGVVVKCDTTVTVAPTKIPSPYPTWDAENANLLSPWDWSSNPGGLLELAKESWKRQIEFAVETIANSAPVKFLDKMNGN